ncbi:MAG: CoA transferase [Deltaproteobacteria bacterium]|nr:CoA transferase [Deltaproteobacteria bacterium]MBW2025346.1 CoA transferase [Deltaproteobacteria bacterium]MBW2125213.1 CoA transferase [Deltaproteobacteria bacterium]
MRLPLDGIRILDFSSLLPGPYCTVFLADFGAEVIKIEEPSKGDGVRWFPPFINGISARHLLVNRNKKSIKLNLKKAEEKEVAKKLIETADVLVEGFRPGVMERLGLGYQTVREINSQIIYCSISGYGQNGPYRNLVGHDINYLGFSGILDLTGEKDGRPVVPGCQVSDIGGGMLAIIGILLALIYRSKTGKGQYIDISMLDGAIAQLYATAGDYFATGIPPRRGDNKVSRVLEGYACYTIYMTKDNKYVTVGALEEKFWASLCQKLGREDFIEAQFVPEKQDEMKRVLSEIFRTKTRDEWMKELEGLDIPFGPVYTVEEAFKDPHVLFRKMITEMEHPAIGKVKQIGIPIKFSEIEGRIRTPAPALGEHTSEILEELGCKGEES